MGDPTRGPHPHPQTAPSGWELAAETIAVKIRWFLFSRDPTGERAWDDALPCRVAANCRRPYNNARRGFP